MKLKQHLFISTALLVGTIGISQIAQSAPQAKKVPRQLVPISITSPKNGAQVKTPLSVHGKAPKGQRVGVTVTTIHDGGQKSLGTMYTTTKASGDWATRPIQLLAPKGAKNVSFKIVASYQKQKKTYTSNTVEVTLEKKLVALHPDIQQKVKPIPKVIPAAPVAPANYVKPTITYPRPNIFYTMPSSYPVKGTGTPNRNVRITIVGKWQQDGRAKSRQLDQKTIRIPSNGKWNTDMRYESVGVSYPTSYDVMVEDPILGDKTTVTVQENIKPVITIPSENTKWTYNANYAISGKGSPNHELRISLIATWAQYNGNTRQSQRRQLDYTTAQVRSNGHWTARVRFDAIDTGGTVHDVLYQLVVEDSVTREQAATVIKTK